MNSLYPVMSFVMGKPNLLWISGTCNIKEPLIKSILRAYDALMRKSYCDDCW